MTVKEIEKLVATKVEQIIKQFQKIAPSVVAVVGQVQKNLRKIDVSVVTNKMKQMVDTVKSKMKALSNSKAKVKLEVSNEEAKKQISQFQKEINSLQNRISSRKVKLELNEASKKNIEDSTYEKVKAENPKAKKSELKKQTQFALMDDKGYTKLTKEGNKLNSEIGECELKLQKAKEKMYQLQEGSKGTGESQKKVNSSFGTLKGKMEQAKSVIGKFKEGFGQVAKITQPITNGIKKIGSGIMSGVGKVVKFATNLFSIKSIYGTLSGCAQSWLSSQDSGAQQLSANIEYLKNSMGGVFAPIIQTVINLVYQLMKAIQSVVYAFSGVNIFAKSTATSMNKTAGSATKASKSLNGLHGEINNVSDNNEGSSSGAGGGISADLDLSGVDMQMGAMAQMMYDFFNPLVVSWNTYGTGLIEQVKVTAGQIGGLISSVWGSFEKIIANGTVYSILGNILSIIGNIAEAFSNAWNYNGNGDAIIQGLADTLNNLLIAIDNVVQSEGFQEWLNWCSGKFREMAEKLGSINWQPLIDALVQIGEQVGTVAIEIFNTLVDVFKWLVENPIVAEILLSIAIAMKIVAGAIGLITTAMEIYNLIMPIATKVSTAFGLSIGWLIAIIVAIIAIIALVVLAIMNWDNIMKALSDTWEWIKQKAEEIFTAVGEFFASVWQGICDTVITIWNAICDFFKGIWDWIVQTVTNTFNNIKQFITDVLNVIATIWNNIWSGISSFVTNIWNGIISIVSNVINTIKDIISNILNTIKTIWNNIWEGLKTTVTNIFNGIWDAIRTVINWILGGIEGMANGVINGINFVIKSLNRLSFKMPDWLGGGQFGFNIQTLNTVSLPRLAKGNVAYSPLIAQFGEYAGATHNPEITAPQNILRETFEGVLLNYEWNNNGQNIELSVNVGNEKLGKILLDNLRNMKRQTGKGIEVLIGE